MQNSKLSNNDYIISSDSPSQVGYQIISSIYIIIGIISVAIFTTDPTSSPFIFLIGIILMFLGIITLIYLHLNDIGSNSDLSRTNSIAKNILFIPLYVGISSTIVSLFICFIARRYNFKFLLNLCDSSLNTAK